MVFGVKGVNKVPNEYFGFIIKKLRFIFFCEENRIEEPKKSRVRTKKTRTSALTFLTIK